jgi:hypothetical protein
MAEQNNIPSDVDTKTQDLSARWLRTLRNLPLIAGLIVLGTVATYLSGLWGALPDGFKAAVVSWIPVHELHDSQSDVLRSGYNDKFFNRTWYIKEAHDEPLDNFKPRYTYTGSLRVRPRTS